MKTELEAQDKEIEILQHTILYYYDNGQDMPEHEQEHVQEMIIEGCCSGELCDSNDGKTEISGRWEISRD